MSADKKEKLLDHNYDGIQELDNSLPGWWLASFYITIIFAVGYYVHFQLGNGPSIQTEFNRDMAEIAAKKAAMPQPVFPNVEKLHAMYKNPEKIALGKAVYTTRCVSCHGDKGQGIVGPNLTDNYWINGDGSVESIAKIAYTGVAEKGMPPWGLVLTEDEMYNVVAYAASLKGTNPAGAKAPQGNLVK